MHACQTHWQSGKRSSTVRCALYRKENPPCLQEGYLVSFDHFCDFCIILDKIAKNSSEELVKAKIKISIHCFGSPSSLSSYKLPFEGADSVRVK